MRCTHTEQTNQLIENMRDTVHRCDGILVISINLTWNKWSTYLDIGIDLSSRSNQQFSDSEAFTLSGPVQRCPSILQYINDFQD